MKIKLILFYTLSSTLSWCSEKNTVQASSIVVVTEQTIKNIAHQQVGQLQELSTLEAVSTMSREQDTVMKRILEMIEKLSTRVRTIEMSQKTLEKRLDAVEVDKKKDTL